MSDYSTPNLPSKNFDQTEAFYDALGFERHYRDDGWMILERGDLVLEFFLKVDNDPKTSWFSACFRVDDLDALYDSFSRAKISDKERDIPRLTPISQEPHGIRLFNLIDCDGSLIRCIDNLYQTS